jgi:phospholipid/cholesterol/gamma-HCH transport system substrate-binding protein
MVCGKYLALATGGDDKVLKPGGTITITQGSINLEALLGKFIFPSGVGKPAAGGDAKAAPSSGGIAPLK